MIDWQGPGVRYREYTGKFVLVIAMLDGFLEA